MNKFFLDCLSVFIGSFLRSSNTLMIINAQNNSLPPIFKESHKNQLKSIEIIQNPSVSQIWNLIVQAISKADSQTERTNKKRIITPKELSPPKHELLVSR